MKLFKRKAERTEEGGIGAELEPCVLCRCMTSVPKSQSVTEREYYVQGAGQLCEIFYRRVYFPYL